VKMIRLYKNALHPEHWVASVPGTGWVAFPAHENGWRERRPARGLDPLHLREVPIECAAASGILQTESEFAGVA
jgi:hypothetical protein